MRRPEEIQPLSRKRTRERQKKSFYRSLLYAAGGIVALLVMSVSVWAMTDDDAPQTTGSKSKPKQVRQDNQLDEMVDDQDWTEENLDQEQLSPEHDSTTNKSNQTTVHKNGTVKKNEQTKKSNHQNTSNQTSTSNQQQHQSSNQTVQNNKRSPQYRGSNHNNRSRDNQNVHQRRNSRENSRYQRRPPSNDSSQRQPSRRCEWYKRYFFGC